MNTAPRGFALPANDAQQADEVLAQLRAALSRLRFGTVTLTVHDGRVVQLDITERTRFPA